MLTYIVVILAIACIIKWLWKEHKEDKTVKGLIQLIVFGGIATWCVVHFGWLLTAGGIVILLLCGIWDDL